MEKSSYLLIWVACLLALPVKAEKLQRCGLRLIGVGKFVYPGTKMDRKIPKKYAAGENVTKNCILFGKIGWLKPSVLHFIHISRGSQIQLRQFNTSLTSSREIFTNESILLQEKRFTFFKIVFPRNGARFTAKYVISVTNADRCSPLWENDRNIKADCTSQWNDESDCKVQCKRGYYLKSIEAGVDEKSYSSVRVSCRVNASGEPAWKVLAVDSVSPTIPQHTSINTEDESEVFHGRCETISCSTIQDNFQIISCTNGSNHRSKCAMKCSEGTAPSPSTYRSYKNRFSIACRDKGGYASWEPTIDVGLMERHPQRRPDIYCVELSSLTRPCFGSDEVDVVSCPYSTDLLLDFFNEEYDGEGRGGARGRGRDRGGARGRGRGRGRGQVLVSSGRREISQCNVFLASGNERKPCGAYARKYIADCLRCKYRQGRLTIPGKYP